MYSLGYRSSEGQVEKIGPRFERWSDGRARRNGAVFTHSFVPAGGPFPPHRSFPSAEVEKQGKSMNTMVYDALLPRAPSSELLTTDLVERLRAGEIAAVGEAYDQHHEHVRRFARRLVGDEDAAEDLVHETFLTLPRAIKRFEGRSALRTFLVSIAVNHSRHYVRAAVRRRSALERAGREPTAPGHSSDDESPEKTAHRKQLASVLTRALDKLSMDHRVTFVLCEVEERSSREVAEVLGIPEGTVRTRLMHAKKKLRALIGQEGFA